MSRLNPNHFALPLLAFSLGVACAHAPRAAFDNTSFAVRVVDSSRSGQPLPGAHLRITTVETSVEMVRCLDSTTSAVIVVPALAAGRYRLGVSRVGYDGRQLVIDIPRPQSDTLVIGLRYTTRDLDDPIVTVPRADSRISRLCVPQP